MIPAEDDVPALRKEARRLRVTVSCLFLLMVVLALVNLGFLQRVRQSERDFEKMYPSREQLPELTIVVLDYARMGGGLPLVVGVLLPTFALGSLLFFTRSSLFRHVLPTVWNLCLAIHLLVMTFAMQLPLIILIQGTDAPMKSSPMSNTLPNQNH